MDQDEFIPTLSHATERDIDLLIVEELHASHDFVVWMASKVGTTGTIASWDVKHSKRRTRSRREIDIFLELTHPDGTQSAILIENKLDTNEQPDQAESYREELDTLTGDFSDAAMVIVCPETYAEKHSLFTGKFDATVTYEDIGAYLVESSEEAGSDTVLRYRFRAEIIDQAIHKHRRGYTPVPDKIVGDFNARYVALLSEIAPHIKPGNSMLKPANPRESTSMIFDQAKSLSELPAEIRPRRFAHELGRGSSRRANYVAVAFPGWGILFPAFSKQLKEDAAETMASFSAKPPTKLRRNPGLVMSFPTAPVDNQADFDDQIPLLTAGINRAAELKLWLLDNQEILWRWRSLISGTKGEIEL